MRAINTTPDQMLISAGFTQALTLTCRALKRVGHTAVAVEDPCFGMHRQTIQAAGLRPLSIPGDAGGFDVAALGEQDVRAVLIAPAHAYPTGAVLTSSRRAALLDWAAARDGLIIEDDYDAEFRYDRQPISALQGLNPERVLYAGCASKTLSPALRLGWIASPTWLIDDLAHEKLVDDLGSPVLEQLALARFITSGGYTRHLRRVRPIYRRRRAAAVTAVAGHLPECTVTGIDAGLHLYVRLPASCDEHTLLNQAREHGVMVEGARWHHALESDPEPGLVIGYGALTEPAIDRGISTLGTLYRKAINVADKRTSAGA